MKPDCLNERDLILLYYHEIPDGTTAAEAARHLAACPACQARRERLALELARIPVSADPDPVVATRIAARVNEQLDKKRPWLPVAGVAVAGAMVLAVTLVVWMPAGRPPAPATPQPVASIEQPFVGPPLPAVRQAALDLDLLEQFDLLEELETLRDIEGV